MACSRTPKWMFRPDPVAASKLEDFTIGVLVEPPENIRLAYETGRGAIAARIALLDLVQVFCLPHREPQRGEQLAVAGRGMRRRGGHAGSLADAGLRSSHIMTFVDPGAIVECDARTQGAPIGRHMGATEDAAARRRAHPGDTTFIV